MTEQHARIDFMRYKTQDPQFYIETDAPYPARLVGQSGPVPEDEPLFILRARDALSVKAIEAYLLMVIGNSAPSEHATAVLNRIYQFQEWARMHPERMKIPDTDVSQLHDGKPGSLTV